MLLHKYINWWVAVGLHEVRQCFSSSNDKAIGFVIVVQKKNDSLGIYRHHHECTKIEVYASNVKET